MPLVNLSTEAWLLEKGIYPYPFTQTQEETT